MKSQTQKKSKNPTRLKVRKNPKEDQLDDLVGHEVLIVLVFNKTPIANILGILEKRPSRSGPSSGPIYGIWEGDIWRNNKYLRAGDKTSKIDPNGLYQDGIYFKPIYELDINFKQTDPGVAQIVVYLN